MDSQGGAGAGAGNGQVRATGASSIGAVAVTVKKAAIGGPGRSEEGKPDGAGPHDEKSNGGKPPWAGKPGQARRALFKGR